MNRPFWNAWPRWWVVVGLYKRLVCALAGHNDGGVAYNWLWSPDGRRGYQCDRCKAFVAREDRP